MSQNYTGGCQCGNIRYEIVGTPNALVVCHCTDCQRQSGSAFGMTLPVNEADFRLTKGEVKKGDVLSVAQVAGIMGAKKTADIIPMCHPLSLTGVDLSFHWEERDDEYELHIESFVKTKGSTGVEMEALTAASVCALTIYDMCKAIDKGIIIGPTYLMEKTGGKNGDYKRLKA